MTEEDANPGPGTRLKERSWFGLDLFYNLVAAKSVTDSNARNVLF